jgi:diguanylate cyclase (GGDEF)-like protein
LKNSTSEKKRRFGFMKERIRKVIRDNHSILGDCALINARRLYYLSLIDIPLRMVNIYLFQFKQSYDTPTSKIWSQGIAASHFTLLVFMIGFLFISRSMKRKNEPHTAMFILQYVVVIVIMASGIVIVTFDQLVTSNITPFLLISIVCGTVFLIRPSISFIIFAASYTVYYFSIAFTISNHEVLFSNRVNGITAVAIGFFLSLIMWHYNYTNITQMRHIQNQQKQLERMAYYDPLTDLPNRRLFDKLVKQEYSSMQRHGHESAIVILDIDDFKYINDTYGHPAGDNILIQLGELLKSNVRESDTVSRFGGEEFMILLPKISLEGGYAFAERLREFIEEKRFTIGSTSLRVTCSFGVSLLSGTNNQGPDDYYFLADKALYMAKQDGKNRVETACESLDTTSS